MDWRRTNPQLEVINTLWRPFSTWQHCGCLSNCCVKDHKMTATVTNILPRPSGRGAKQNLNPVGFSPPGSVAEAPRTFFDSHPPAKVHGRDVQGSVRSLNCRDLQVAGLNGRPHRSGFSPPGSVAKAPRAFLDSHPRAKAPGKDVHGFVRSFTCHGLQAVEPNITSTPLGFSPPGSVAKAPRAFLDSHPRAKARGKDVQGFVRSFTCHGLQAMEPNRTSTPLGFSPQSPMA